MDIQKELAKFKQTIDSELGRFLDAEIADAKKSDRYVAEALSHTKNILLSGGKRVRGAMMYHGYLAAGGTKRLAAVRASMSIELVHLYLLMHDDVMDRDDRRHGVETIHARYARRSGRAVSQEDALHFGNAMAISIGDMLAAYGGKCLFSSPFPSENIVLALNRLQEIVSSTVIGQVKDIRMGFASGIADEEEVLAMYRLKTARYTLEGPLGLGATLAGGPEALVNSFSVYAIPLGVAYQLQDDILGIYGKNGETGKTTGSDLEEGKMTLLVAAAYARGNREEKQGLEQLLGKPVTRASLAKSRRIFEKTGALEYARELNAKLLREAMEAARKIPSESMKAKEFFTSVISFLERRNV